MAPVPDAATVKAADVEVIRQGGPGSHLLLLARLGMAAGLLAVIAIVILIVRRRKKAKR